MIVAILAAAATATATANAVPPPPPEEKISLEGLGQAELRAASPERRGGKDARSDWRFLDRTAPVARPAEATFLSPGKDIGSGLKGAPRQLNANAAYKPKVVLGADVRQPSADEVRQRVGRLLARQAPNAGGISDKTQPQDDFRD